MPAASLLTDIKIADMTSILFGPSCTQTLADMGAEVVKIEPKVGDIARNIGTSAKTPLMGPMHMTVNRGKRSVVWDLKSELGKEATRRLIQNSDVFIHNIRPDALQRLGLSFEEVKEIKKDIVYVHCLGFGTDGEYSGRPAYDDLIQGYSGITSLLPRVDSEQNPSFFPMAVADKVGGLHAVHATLAALLRRDKTGEAVHVEVPMFECVTNFVLEDHLEDATFDPPTGEIGYERQLDPTRNPIKTADGWIIIAPYTDDRWVRTFDLLGAPEELEDDRVNNPKVRRANRQYMQQRMETYIDSNTTAYWLELFSKNDIPVAPVHELEDLQNDPHLRAAKFFQKREHPTEGSYWEMQPPIRFKGIPEKEISHARHIGEDTEDVLNELGLEAEK